MNKVYKLFTVLLVAMLLLIPISSRAERLQVLTPYAFEPVLADFEQSDLYPNGIDTRGMITWSGLRTGSVAYNNGYNYWDVYKDVQNQSYPFAIYSFFLNSLKSDGVTRDPQDWRSCSTLKIEYYMWRKNAGGNQVNTGQFQVWVSSSGYTDGWLLGNANDSGTTAIPLNAIPDDRRKQITSILIRVDLPNLAGYDQQRIHLLSIRLSGCSAFENLHKISDPIVPAQYSPWVLELLPSNRIMYYCKGSFLASENVQRDRIWRTASYTGNKMANWVNDIPVLMGPNLDQNDEQYLSCSPGMLVVGSPWVWHMYYVVGPAAATVMNLSLYHAKASDTAGLTWPQPDRAELRIRRGVPPNYTYTLFSDFLVEQCPIVGGQNCFIENPTPIKVGNNIDLYFIGQLHDGNRKLYRMQGISSSNYIDFTEPQPVYTPANMAGMSSGHVTYYNNMYYFVYAGNTAHYGEPTRIDLATCNPSWVCSVETIMSAGTGTWDLDHKFSPFLFVDGTKFSVYYAGNIDPTDPNWFWGALSTIGIRQYNIP